MIENIQKLLERDGKLDELLIKGEDMVAVSTNLVKTTKEVKKEYKKRSYCCTAIWVTLAIIAIVIIVILIVNWTK